MGILNSVLKTFVGDKNKKDLAKILPLVKEINAKQQAMEPLSADELRAITGKLKTGIQDARKEVDAQIEEQHQLLARLSNMEEKEAVYNTIDQLEEEGQPLGSFRVVQSEFFIPINEAVDPLEERKKLTQELEYAKGFLKSVEKKLSNERFVSNAPEKVIELERKKAADAQDKIDLLEKSLSQL